MSDLDKLIPDFNTFKILIIDDKPNMRKTIRNMLRVLGFKSFQDAEDGIDALRKLQVGNFDFVLCDWNMPRMSGYEFLLQLRQDDRFRDLPFLMVTAEVEEATVAQAIESDVDGYIIKPFIPKVLEEKMVEILTKRLEPSEIDIQLQLADVLMKAGRYTNAHRELDKAQKIVPRSPRVHYSRGLIHLKERNLAEAEKSFLLARQMGPQFIKAKEKLAEIYQETNRHQEMINVIREAVQVSPNNPDRQTQLGKSLLEAGRTEEAKKVFNTAINLDPENASRQTEIGEAFLSKEMNEEAEASFKAAIQKNPQEVHIYNRLGIAFRRQEKYQEALDNYKIALQLQPDEENLHFNLSRVYYDLGNDSEAIICLRQALKIFPDFEEARELLDKIQKSKSD